MTAQRPLSGQFQSISIASKALQTSQWSSPYTSGPVPRPGPRPPLLYCLWMRPFWEVTQVESYAVWPLVSGSSHSACCLRGSCTPQHV